MNHRWLLYRLLLSLSLMTLLVASLIGSGFVGMAVAHSATTTSANIQSIPRALSPDGDPLLLVHGWTDTCDFAFNRTDVVPNTGLNAKRTIEYLENNDWDASALDLIGYYDPFAIHEQLLSNGTTVPTIDGTTNESVYDSQTGLTAYGQCTSNLQEMGASDSAAFIRCLPLLGSNTGGSFDDPIEHLGCLLAWYIYDTYGVRPVDILAHSMGGLIVRDAIGEAGHPTANSSLFPPAPLNVHVVVTVGTPHGGVYGEYMDLAQNLGSNQELRDMDPTSPFMRLLGSFSPLEPQGLVGTYWALMASSMQCGSPYQSSYSEFASCQADIDPQNRNPLYPDGDGVIQADSALAMPADLKVLYGAGYRCPDNSVNCADTLADVAYLSGDEAHTQYAHEANSCVNAHAQPFLGLVCLHYPFYLNDGTSGSTQGWICNSGCTHGLPGPGKGGMVDMNVIVNGKGTGTSRSVLHSLAEIVAIFISQGPGTYPPPSSGSNSMVALNSSYTLVAIGGVLYKYDLGGSGTTMLSGHLIGTQVYSYPISALAVNGQYLFVALANHRVVKTTWCGTGNNMCALSDGIGSGSLGGYSYWIGYQDFSVPVTGLAATPTTLYTNLAGGGVQRTVKTTLCGTGSNMCALSDSVGSGGLSGYSYWVGIMDWAWAPTAIAANDSIVLTTIGSTRVCKTTPGSSGNNVFALSDGTCTGNYPGYHYWIGYQDWSTTVTSLAIDNSSIWWSLGSIGRLVQTTWCDTGANACALTPDGIGTNTENNNWHDWIGRQDWCAGYNQMGVASNNQFVDALFTTGTVIRVVKATRDGGANMFATSDCTGTGSESGWNDWIGSQDFTVS